MHADLIPMPIRVARRRGARVRTWASICGTYVCILVCAYGAVAAAIDSDPSGIADRLALRVRENGKQQAQVKETTAELQSAQRVLDANHAVGDQPDWSILLAMVSLKTEDRVVLRAFQITPQNAPATAEPPGGRDAQPNDSGRFLVKIKGFARTQSEVAAFVLRLEGEGVFDKVELLESKREAFGSGEAIGFALNCAVGGGGARGSKQ